ncbi:ribulose-phosphate 3-epimerase [Orbus mooreae]|uniref:ribulose-phosphate 3-epimerase n=1 Tax=Orbus mooreae TaxID=3074107 RepID=UPI00370D780D
MIIAPSLFNSDLYLIQANLARLEKSGISHLHIDVMDSHYVPILGFNANFVANLKTHSNFILDCHLMVEKPEDRVESFIKAGADIITFHAEATVHHMVIINQLLKHNIKVGIAINPGTPVELIQPLLPFVDLVLVMTVNPGRAGETFLPFTVEKIAQLSALKLAHSYHYDIQVDGNITDQTIVSCVNAGANNIVSGGFIFNNNEIEHNILQLTCSISK